MQLAAKQVVEKGLALSVKKISRRLPAISIPSTDSISRRAAASRSFDAAARPFSTTCSLRSC